MAQVRIDMVALRAFEHDGECYASGECFQVPPVVAAKMKYQREADFATRALLGERRTYRRRDMVAER